MKQMKECSPGQGETPFPGGFRPPGRRGDLNDKRPDIQLGELPGMSKAFRVETCFQARGCPNGLVPTGEIAQAIEELISAEGLDAKLREKAGGALKMHQIFRVSISGCPNACSRPQITDIGLIGALAPEITDVPCTRCGSCSLTCRERAVIFPEGAAHPAIDGDKCLRCGECVACCPSGTLSKGKRGFRVLLGGKLGRHPQLGRELVGLSTPEEAVRIVAACIRHFIDKSIGGERFGDLLNRTGCSFL